MPVRVVTDTSAGLPEHVARDLGITVLDLHMVGDEDDKSTSGLSSLELAGIGRRRRDQGHGRMRCEPRASRGVGG